MFLESIKSWKLLSALQRSILQLNFLFGLSRGIVIPFLFLELKDRYGASLTAISAIVSLSILTRILGSLAGGYGADNYDKRKLILGGALLNSFCFLGLAVKSSLSVAGAIYLTINLLQSAYRTVFSTVIGESIKKEETRIAYAFFHASQNLAMGLGALLGAWIMGISGESIYIVCFAALFIFSLLIYKNPSFKNLEFKDKTSSNNQRSNQSNKKTLSFLINLKVSRKVFILISLNTVLVLCYGVFNEILGVMFNAAEISLKYVGSLFSLNAILIVLFQVPIANRTKSWSFNKSIRISTVLFAAYLAALYTMYQSQPLLWAALAVTLFTGAEMLHVSVMNAEVNHHSNEFNRGRNFGILNASWSAGFGLGPAFIAYISDKSSFAFASLMLMLVLLLASFTLLTLFNNKKLELQHVS
ncbi:MAG: MFS transporter [Bdellovibrionota bacterium]